MKALKWFTLFWNGKIYEVGIDQIRLLEREVKEKSNAEARSGKQGSIISLEMKIKKHLRSNWRVSRKRSGGENVIWKQFQIN